MSRSFLIAIFSVAVLASALAAEPPALTEVIHESFPKWDTDHDGQLTLAEIESGVTSAEVKGPEAAALAAIYRATRVKTGPLAPPVTAAILEEKAGGGKGTQRNDADESTDAQNSDLVLSYQKALARIEATPHVLFTAQTPHLETFRQGKIGSCFCLAPLAALIYRNPVEAAQRFTPAAGGFEVRLNDQRYVWVSAPTDGEIAVSSTAGPDGFWSTVYEKAIGQMRIEDRGVAGPPLRAATGGSAGTMVSVLTGRNIKRFSCSPWRQTDATPAMLAAKLDELRAMLRENVSTHRIMTVGTGTKGEKVPSLSPSHAYAVLGYDPISDTVTIRDPHCQDFEPKGAPGLQNGYAVQHGVFSAPLPEVVKIMGGFAFEQADAASNTPAGDADPAIGL